MRRKRKGFRKLTAPQRATLAALRQLGGEMSITPADARPLRALQRRGLVRYRKRADGTRVAVLRVQRRARDRRERSRSLVDRLWKWLTRP